MMAAGQAGWVLLTVGFGDSVSRLLDLYVRQHSRFKGGSQVRSGRSNFSITAMPWRAQRNMKVVFLPFTIHHSRFTFI